MTRAQLEVGELVLLTSGAYSDYEVLLLGRVLRPLTREVYEAACVALRSGDYVDPNQLAAWLLREGYLEEVEFKELALRYVAPKWEAL